MQGALNLIPGWETRSHMLQLRPGEANKQTNKQTLKTPALTRAPLTPQGTRPNLGMGVEELGNSAVTT